MNSRKTGRVSIIIPAYNRVNYIISTATSALRQTYPDTEVIIVDDGSNDGTFELLKELQEQHSFYLLNHPHRENKGQSAAINLGLSHATGEFINILDSDDLLHPEKLAIEVDFLNNHPEIGLVYSNGYAIDANGDVLYKMYGSEHKEHNDVDRLLLDCYVLLPQNSLVRRSCFDRAGFFEETFRSAQDHDMILRIAEITKMAFIPEHLFYYRRHDDSISATKQDVRWTTGFEILQRAQRRYPYKRRTVRKRAAVLHFRMAQVHWRRAEYGEAFARALRAGLLDPVRSIRVALGRERIQ